MAGGISPKRMLLLTRQKNAVREGLIGREQVDELNRACASFAEKQLYAHLHHKNIERLAKQYKDSKPRMTVSGFRPENFSEVKIPRGRPSS